LGPDVRAPRAVEVENVMKNLVLALVVSLGLAACEGAGLPGGVDAVDAGAEATQTVDGTGVDGGAHSVCQALPATTFGNACLLHIPDGVDCTTARLFVGGVEVQFGEFNRSCDGAEPQIQVAGAACSRLESHAVATIGCL
jgi:hypothetical protein